MYPKNAASKGGTSAANSSMVKLVKSNTSVVWVGRSRYRSIGCPSSRGGHSITQIVMNSKIQRYERFQTEGIPATHKRLISKMAFRLRAVYEMVRFELLDMHRAMIHA